MFHKSILLIVSLTLLACGSKGNDHTIKKISTTPPTKEDAMITIRNSDDLLQLRQQYLTLWKSGFSGTMDITIEAGDYPEVGWSLEKREDSLTMSEASQIKVIVNGNGNKVPLPRSLRAHSLTLKNVIVSGYHSEIRLEISSELVLSSCLFVDGRGTSKDNSAYIRIIGLGKKGEKPHPVNVSIADSWFVRNFQTDQDMSTIAFDSDLDSRAYFDNVVIDQTVFWGNAFNREIDVQYAKNLSLKNSIFYKTWAQGGIIGIKQSGQVKIENSIFVNNELAPTFTIENSPLPEFDAKSYIFAAKGSEDISLSSTIGIAPSNIKSASDLVSLQAQFAGLFANPMENIPESNKQSSIQELFATVIAGYSK